LDILNFIVGAKRGAKRAENRVERSGERALQKTMERCGERSGMSRRGNGAGSEDYRIHCLNV